MPFLCYSYIFLRKTVTFLHLHFYAGTIIVVATPTSVGTPKHDTTTATLKHGTTTTTLKHDNYCNSEA
jgi:hypothetical protein